MSKIRRIIAAGIFAGGLGCNSFAEGLKVVEPACVTVGTIDELDAALLLLKTNAQSVLVYFRADWAIAGTEKNDVYVPSIAFFKALGKVKCIVADVTKLDAGVDLKRFGADGIPFFVAFNANGKKVGTLQWAREFYEFRPWFRTLDFQATEK